MTQRCYASLASWLAIVVIDVMNRLYRMVFRMVKENLLFWTR